MNRLLGISIVFFIFLSANANSLDSLRKISNDNSLHDTNRLNAINVLLFSEDYLGSYPDTVLYYASLQYELAEKIGNEGYVAQALNSQSLVYAARGAFDIAIDLVMKSISINEKIGLKEGLVHNLIHLGNIYLDLSDYPGAMKQYQKTLELLNELNDDGGKGTALNNIGEIYRETGDFQQALLYYTRSYEIQKKVGYVSGMATALLNIGEVHKSEKNFEDALNYYKQSLDLYKKVSDKASISFALACMGDVYIEQGLLVKSDSILPIALQMAQEVGTIIEIRLAAKCLYKLYKVQGRSKEALVMHELYTQMKDSIESKESSRKLMQKDYQYQYEQEQILEETKHNDLIVLSKEREKRQLLISYGTGFSLIVLLIFFFGIYKRYKLAEEQKDLIEEKNQNITESIQYAKRIQQASLISPDYLNELFDDIFVYYEPKDIVSGDYYWAHQINDEQVMVAVCDCTGHGVPGAFMSMISNSLLNEIVIDNKIHDVDMVLNQLTNQIIKTLRQDKDKIEALDGLDMTLLMIDKKTKTVHFSGAGHSLYMFQNGEIKQEKGDPYPVGYFFGRRKPYHKKVISLSEGDVLYLSSDGYTEQFGPKNKKKFGYGVFKKLLLDICRLPMNEQRDTLEKTMVEWREKTPQVDDILVMGIKM